MKRSKWFLLLAILFVVLMGIASYDFGRRTSFPGAKNQQKGQKKEAAIIGDSISQTQKK